MSFGTGLSGLNAASKNLDVIGHNIANANTTGMKAGRAEFAEMYASALGAAGGSNGGIGVTVAAVAQQFTQGNLKITGNNLDMAINGEGFFKVEMTDGSTAYTRNGEFKLNTDGYIVTNNGAKLNGYVPDRIGGVITTGETQPLRLPTGGIIEAQPTTEVTISANLFSGAPVETDETGTVIPLPAAPGEPINELHKKFGTTINVYDELGNAIPLTVYYIKTAPNQWQQVFSKDGDTLLDAGQLIDFRDTDENPPPAPPDRPEKAGYPVSAYTNFDLTIPQDPAGTPTSALTISINYGREPDEWTLSQFGSNFSVFDLDQDGYTAGELVSIDTSESGVIAARYSNGETLNVGQVALSRFRNVQGLQPMNGGYWGETAASGNPIEGQPLTGRFGQVRAGSLEESNVDLTAELVNMIVAQRSYQANAQTIKTQDQVLTTLVNLR